MVKETYIYKELKEQMAEDDSNQKNLDQITDYLKDNYSVEVCVCEIFGGRRWSFIAGSEDMIVGGKKIKITDELGIVVNNYDYFSEQEWNAVIEVIEKLS